jgi:SulP family sulfate permease
MQLFNEINLRNIRGDVFGGITAAVIALPMALAFGVASGAGAEAGLYGAILVGLFAALFGGSPCLMSEPTGPMTVVFTAVIAKLIATDPVNGMAMAFTVVILFHVRHRHHPDHPAACSLPGRARTGRRGHRCAAESA